MKKDAKLKRFIARAHVNKSNNVYRKIKKLCAKQKQKSHRTGEKNNFRISIRSSPFPSAPSF
jgi:hypothetical protein